MIAFHHSALTRMFDLKVLLVFLFHSLLLLIIILIFWFLRVRTFGSINEHNYFPITVSRNLE